MQIPKNIAVKLTETQLYMVQNLGKGRNNATTKQILRNITGTTDRQVRANINVLRKYFPIAASSNGNGYFICDNKDEIFICIRINQRQMDGYAKTIENLKEHFKKMSKQKESK